MFSMVSEVIDGCGQSTRLLLPPSPHAAEAFLYIGRRSTAESDKE